MPSLDAIADAMQRHLEKGLGETAVPGGAIGLSLEGQRRVLAAGTANLATGETVHHDTLFQIGSVTKVYTATQVMRLVDEGLVELDAPVTRYLPDLEIAGRPVPDLITIDSLITHRSGIEGDDFRDFGPGDDSLERFVAGLGGTGIIHPPDGRLWSYCNTGYILLGRIIEVLRGKPWPTALQHDLLDPLGCERATARVDEAILHRVAVGHIPHPGTRELVRAPRYITSYSAAPAGSTLTSAPDDVLRFAELHLSDGRAADGTVLLRPETARLMREPRFSLAPVVTEFSQGGITWGIGDVGGVKVVGHPGGTLGQASLLIAVPERQFAMVVLTNAPGGAELAFQLTFHALGLVTGMDLGALMPQERPRAPQLDLARYAGVYERLNGRFDVTADGDALIITSLTAPLTPPEFRLPPDPVRFTPLDAGVFVSDVGGRIVFLEFDEEGRPGYLSDTRLARRTGSTATDGADR